MATPTILLIPDRYKSGVLYSQLPESGAVDFGVTRATTAYRTNASGILESVASGVPRLDYPAAGGCPSLLVEPAATNLLLRSEEFDNASWTKVSGGTGSVPVVTANTVTAPDGTLTADTIFLNAGSGTTINDTSRVVYNISLTVTEHTFSVYLKGAVGGEQIQLVSPSGGFFRVVLTTEWHRYSITATGAATVAGRAGVSIRRGLTEPIDASATFYAWGAQLETGSVATSYIPTTAATATRNADVISKTGVSGFIGQTEGTLYIDLDYNQPPNDSGGRLLNVYETNDTTNSILSFISNVNQFQLTTFSGGAPAVVIAASAATIVPFGQNKFAIAYNGVNYTVYRNGLLFGSGTGLAPASLTAILLGSSLFNPRSINNRIRAAAIYTTRLSNAELAALTTL